MNDDYYLLISQVSDMDATIVTEKKSTEFYHSLNDCHQVFVVEEVATKRLIGTGTILIEKKLTNNYGSVGHIEDVVIDEKYHRFSLKKILIEYLTDTCIFNKQCYKCVLTCNRYNEEFYMNSGYMCNELQISLYKKY